MYAHTPARVCVCVCVCVCVRVCARVHAANKEYLFYNRKRRKHKATSITQTIKYKPTEFIFNTTHKHISLDHILMSIFKMFLRFETMSLTRRHLLSGKCVVSFCAKTSISDHCGSKVIESSKFTTVHPQATPRSKYLMSIITTLAQAIICSVNARPPR